MESVFRNDVTEQETSFFLRETFLLPVMLRQNNYAFASEDVRKVINDVKEALPVANTANVNFSDATITENFMKRCFNKCKRFVLEDWVDYDELDCTMRCTLLHKKSLNLMNDVNKNI